MTAAGRARCRNRAERVRRTSASFTLLSWPSERRRLFSHLFWRPLREPRRKNMTKNLYVGNLPFQTTADDLREAFGQYGTVARAQVVADRETGRSRGFGFVEMEDGAEEAIAKMNGVDYQGRTLTVNEAKPREER